MMHTIMGNVMGTTKEYTDNEEPKLVNIISECGLDREQSIIFLQNVTGSILSTLHSSGTYHDEKSLFDKIDIPYIAAKSGINNKQAIKIVKLILPHILVSVKNSSTGNPFFDLKKYI